MKDQIPLWSYLNFQILYQIQIAIDNDLEDQTSIKQILLNTNEHIGGTPNIEGYYNSMNVGAIFGLLYSMIVVPKEIFIANNNAYFNDLNLQIKDYFEVENDDGKKLSVQELFRVLRNSISHVNFEIDPKNKFDIRMWNVDHKGNTNIVILSDIEKLSNFAIRVGQFIVKN